MRPNKSMIPKSCRLFGQDHATEQAKIRRCPLLVSAETRTRRLKVAAREHSTLDELDTSRNEPYRAIDRNRALKGKTYP
ncbi:MAG: hypothetical protein QOJ58_4296 [Alphaproteobacteria bacterium]|jgi:hypothetical protein|nr:hypothetical protein [Alphaproteobacteria bacterium]